MINKSRCNSKSYQKKKKKRNLEKKQVTKRVQSSFFLIYTGVGRAKGHYSIGQ